MIEIQEKLISSQKLRELIADETCGAVVIFEGLVRNHHQGKKVTELRYEAFKPMALKVLADIREEALRRWELHDLWIVHRTGLISIEEAAVWVGVASSHRKEAFEACQWAMDEIKLRAPIWKHETYEDGSSVWVEDQCVTAHSQHSH